MAVLTHAEELQATLARVLDPSIVAIKEEDGTTKDGVEYCPYTETSKKYDTRRVNPGLDIVLGNAVLVGVPLHKQRLLDVGCGTGSFLELVSPHFEQLCGVEYNEGMIEQAAMRFIEAHPQKVHLQQGSAQNLPHPDNSFDIVTINQVVHHFSHEEDFAALQAAMNQCFRVLKPGGKLIVNTSTPEQQRDAFWWLELFPEASERICARFPPLDTIIGHMRCAGFTVTSDNVVVPIHRPLMAEERYLDGGVDLAFDPVYRACDSSWEMVRLSGELEAGLQKIRDMKEAGTAEQWLQSREALRRSMGQATFVIATKGSRALREVASKDSQYSDSA